MSIPTASSTSLVKGSHSRRWVANLKGNLTKWVLITLVLTYVAFLVLTPITALIFGISEICRAMARTFSTSA